MLPCPCVAPIVVLTSTSEPGDDWLRLAGHSPSFLEDGGQRIPRLRGSFPGAFWREWGSREAGLLFPHANLLQRKASHLIRYHQSGGGYSRGFLGWICLRLVPELEKPLITANNIDFQPLLRN